ncbi:MAG: chemotaxis protein CheA [Bryobacterales bacterium]|nr:chemotaxis protein CheA [Bryobacterales bacterium]
MTNHEADFESGAALRQCVDDLATLWILGGQERLPEIARSLADLGRQATELGFQDAARVAEELCAALERTGTGESDVMNADGFKEGLARLEQALARPRDPSVAASEEALPADDPQMSNPQAAPPEPQTSSYGLAQDPELVGDFILESREHLTSIEQLVLTLERTPDDTEAIHSIFRGFHTIKGLAGFLEFVPIQEITHEVETALNLAREGNLVVTAAVIDVILEGVDHVGRSIAGIEAGGPCERCPGHELLIEKVRALISGGTALPETPPVRNAEAIEPPSSGVPLDPPPPVSPSTDAVDPAPTPAESPEGPPDAPQTPRTTRRAPIDAPSVRVETSKLDYLVDMVGEMVIAQSLVSHSGALATLSDPRLHRNLSQLARITGEVQRTAMAMRMVPIGQLFQRASRQVRDLSRKIGKNVELVMRGEETELDKSIAEELADPLMHMVRNAIDHGIEPPEDRLQAGKPATARVTLAAYHQGGQIVIEIADDGRGLNAQKILKKAREKGLADENAHLSEAEVYRLILEPGFSTAEQVTNISGRGVGMDVVRKQIEKLRGRIEIHSRSGEGTAFLLHLPLTLAIIDGLVVAIGTERYIVPLFAVTEMFRPSDRSIFTVRGRDEMVMVRGRLLPLLRLYQLFGVTSRTEDPSQALLIVAEGAGQQFCLMVDELIGKQEVVIKSLGEALGAIRGVAGGAILGDGRVGLILDMGGVWSAYARD